ncbi:hypothetical protein BWR22_04310 [Lacinutrix venerupis]|uniref:Uncharacterized protein n=1 Tax=Lacinutrix venerupis TaxID=1486034 RepID=A0AAC9PVG1_9FLAO|nr:hypothetical protein BWR22_04310 [Lacinutrix venerupis]
MAFFAAANIQPFFNIKSFFETFFIYFFLALFMNVAFAFTSVAIALSGCKYTTYFLLRKLLFNLFLILFLQTLLKASNQHIIHPIFFKFFSTICPYYIYTIFNGKTS